MGNKIIRMFYTFCGIGYIKVAPGTIASFITFTLTFFFSLFLREHLQVVLLILLLTFVIVFNFLKDRFLAIWNSKDPKCVVIDEVVGVLLYVLFLNNTNLQWLVVGFVVFRVFDILKPFPLKFLQNMSNINSVILDDIGAAVYAYLVTYGLMEIIK